LLLLLFVNRSFPIGDAFAGILGSLSCRFSPLYSQISIEIAFVATLFSFLLQGRSLSSQSIIIAFLSVIIVT